MFPVLRETMMGTRIQLPLNKYPADGETANYNQRNGVTS